MMCCTWLNIFKHSYIFVADAEITILKKEKSEKGTLRYIDVMYSDNIQLYTDQRLYT